MTTERSRSVGVTPNTFEDGLDSRHTQMIYPKT
jgi:hypothetical protein